MDIDKYLEECIRKIPEIMREYIRGKSYDLDFNDVRKYYNNLNPRVRYIGSFIFSNKESMKTYTPDIYLGYKMMKEFYFRYKSEKDIINKYFPEIKKNYKEFFNEKTILFGKTEPQKLVERAVELFIEETNIFQDSLPILKLYVDYQFNDFLIEKYDLKPIFSFNYEQINKFPLRKLLYFVICQLPLFKMGNYCEPPSESFSLKEFEDIVFDLIETLPVNKASFIFLEMMEINDIEDKKLYLSKYQKFINLKKYKSFISEHKIIFPYFDRLGYQILESLHSSEHFNEFPYEIVEHFGNINYERLIEFCYRNLFEKINLIEFCYF